MQCLLFCPDEKSAGALIPLVEAPDISVKHETEVFSATRTLMSESFAFLIIDCEDEPTRRLFLKNASNSALNRSALAVAVVKRETAANALRFGADFLMTKPVTLEQADKVLRLVRTSVLRNQHFAPPKRVTAANPMEPETESADAQPEFSIPALEMTMAAAAAASASTSATEPGQISFPEPEAPEVESVESTSPAEPISNEEPAEPQPPVAMTVAQIKKPQPRSFMVPMAMAVILLAAGAIAWHIQSQKVDQEPAPAPPQVASAPGSPEVNTTPSDANVPPADQTPEQVAVEPIVSPPGTVPAQPKHAHQEKVQPDAPAMPPGQLSIRSTPSGARVQIDGQEVSPGPTPTNLTALAPGRHNIALSKPGYAPETRTIQIASGGKSSLSVQLVSLAAVVAATSDPSGASLWMDGKDTGRMTPAEFSVDKPGDHTFVFKMQGYLDETVAANLVTGQTFHLAPALRPLGSTDDIKIVGKFKKLFGGGETAGMGTVSVKTQPKGAQIAVNNQTLDKPSPAEFYLNPGAYTIDITQSGYKPIHRTITVEKSGKLAIDEVMDPE